jgi:hypothetical protein
MKRLLLGVALVAAALLSIPLSASAAEYEMFVGCDDLAENPIPSHVCQVGDLPGVFFESDEETEYEVCVKFPDEEVLCRGEQLAEAGILYVNSIFSEMEGTHLVSWYVGGVEIGSWSFRLDAPPPPPPPAPAPVTPLPSVAPVTPPQCLQAQHQVGRLKNRLRSASGRKQRAKIRGKLKSARAKARRLC